MSVDSLFRPGRIGSLELKNRVIKSPQTTALSNPDGTVTPRLVNHYRRLAEGGPALIIVEYSHVDDDAAKSIHNQVGISRREHISGLGWRDGMEFCLALPERAGVVAIPTQPFHDSHAGDQLVRWAFCKDASVIEEGVRRLAAADLAR